MLRATANLRAYDNPRRKVLTKKGCSYYHVRKGGGRLPRSVYEIACIFFLYGFIGWCVEVIYAAVNRGEFVNRGFLFGPICPIYGIGMLAVLAALDPISDNFILLYVGSVAITTALEFLVGLLAEKLFHTRLWDYSDEPFNLKGYVCLKFSLLWGIGALVIVDILHPILMKPINLVPMWLGVPAVCVLGAILLTDFVLTIAEALRLPGRIRAVQEIERLLTTVSDGIGENLADGTLKARGRKDELDAKLAQYRRLFEARTRGLANMRLFRAFPHLRSGRYAERFEKLRQMYLERRDAKGEGDDAKDR